MRFIRFFSICTFVWLFGALVGPAAADWEDGGGLQNFGADYYSAADFNLQHTYSGIQLGDVVSTKFFYDGSGRPSLFQLCRSAAPPYTQLCGDGLNNCPSGSFRTEFGCAILAPSPCPFCSKPTPNKSGQASVGEPINISTGNLFEPASDFETRGQDPLTARRYYSSNTAFPDVQPRAQSDGALIGRFGYGWKSEYDAYIVANGTPSTASSVDMFLGDGELIHFQKSSGAWFIAYWNPSFAAWYISSDPRHDVDYRISTDGTDWFITTADDAVLSFDSASIAGTYFGKLLSGNIATAINKLSPTTDRATTPS
jgi:hypothetical protein